MSSGFFFVFISLLFALLAINVHSFKFARVANTPRFATRRFLFGSPEPKKDPPKKAGLGGFFDNMMNPEAMKLATEFANMTKDLQSMVIETADPRGLVTITFSGIGQPQNVKLSEAAMKLSAEELSAVLSQTLLEAYANNAKTMMSKLGPLAPK